MTDVQLFTFTRKYTVSPLIVDEVLQLRPTMAQIVKPLELLRYERDKLKERQIYPGGGLRHSDALCSLSEQLLAIRCKLHRNEKVLDTIMRHCRVNDG
jgi:hypothetical protein